MRDQAWPSAGGGAAQLHGCVSARRQWLAASNSCWGRHGWMRHGGWPAAGQADRASASPWPSMPKAFFASSLPAAAACLSQWRAREGFLAKPTPSA